MEQEYVSLDHGSGGAASEELVRDIFLSRLDNEILRKMDDSAVLEVRDRRLAMTTDSYVVDPIFFPGGDIGSLSVHGTVNDLAMQGARPVYLTLGLILEEGLPIADLVRIIDSIARACGEAGVSVVAGDTKVVPRGNVDKIFINTAGLGVIPQGVDVSNSNARPGDRVIINGSIGDHGMSLLTTREGLEFSSALKSDSAPLNAVVAAILEAAPEVHALRDPTRGGVATALNEIAGRSGVGIRLSEASLPFSAGVRAASEILGLDPLHVANEGKCLVIVQEEKADEVLRAMQGQQYGKHSAVIGYVVSENPGRVTLETAVGGTRMVSMLTGEQLPRIC